MPMKEQKVAMKEGRKAMTVRRNNQVGCPAPSHIPVYSEYRRSTYVQFAHPKIPETMAGSWGTVSGGWRTPAPE